MSPAKVTPKNGSEFFVGVGQRIQDIFAYDALPKIDREYLCDRRLIGSENGFTMQSQEVTFLELPGGTTITAVKKEELEAAGSVQKER